MILSCSKNDDNTSPVAVIPDIINGHVMEIMVTPVDSTTPGTGSFLIWMTNTIYKVDFNATAQTQSNAVLFFDSDTILTNDSREYANLGKDVIAYRPVGVNEITVAFYDGRKITGGLDAETSFGGTFGEALISQWRSSPEPTKPTQKAKDDIQNFVRRYDDKDGDGPETAPVYLSVTVSKV